MAEPLQPPNQTMDLVIASTFANNELESKKKTLQQYVDLSEKLQSENKKLQEEMEERDKDSLNVLQFLRTEVEKKQDQIEGLQRDLEGQRQKMAEEHAAAAGELRQQLKKADEDALRLQDETRRLEEELGAVAQFKREKHGMEAQIKALEEGQTAMRDKYEKELSRLRFQSLEEKVRLKNEEQGMQRSFAADVNKKAYELLDQTTRRIHNKNHKLEEDNSALQQHLEVLTKLKEEVEATSNSHRRDLELNTQEVEFCTKKGQRLSKEVRELTVKNRELETSLSTSVRAFDKQQTQCKKKYQAALLLRDQQLEETQRTLTTKLQELQRVRALAKQIVLERSELETFFNEALAFVKRQISQTRSQTADQEGKGSQRSLPPIRGSPTPTHSEGRGPGTSSATGSRPRTPSKVDIADLSWEDKERVLRILFAKINNVQSKRQRKGSSGRGPQQLGGGLPLGTSLGSVGAPHPHPPHPPTAAPLPGGFSLQSALDEIGGSGREETAGLLE